jgi:hypothetical protein
MGPRRLQAGGEIILKTLSQPHGPAMTLGNMRETRRAEARDAPRHVALIDVSSYPAETETRQTATLSFDVFKFERSNVCSLRSSPNPPFPARGIGGFF